MAGSVRNKNYIAGALTAATGLFAAYQGYLYGIGDFTEMGPGFFPFGLGGLLVLLGFLLAINRDAEPEPDAMSESPPLDYRGAGCIVGSILLFLAVVQYGGLVPAAFCTTVLAGIGDRGAKPLGTVLLGCVAVLIALILFHGILKLPLPLFTWG
jgi:Tripartite tricarboxylate transporter TctB family